MLQYVTVCGGRSRFLDMEFVGLPINVSLLTGENVKGVVQRVIGTILELDCRGKIMRIDGNEIADLKIEDERAVHFSDYKKSVRTKGTSRKDKKRETFAIPMDDMDKDFDFSASLQLFDKNAIFNEIRYDAGCFIR